MYVTLIQAPSGRAIVQINGAGTPSVEDAIDASNGGAALGKPNMTFRQAAVAVHGDIESAGSITVNGEEADLNSRVSANATVVFSRDQKGG